MADPPQFLLTMEGKMSRYPPKNVQNEQYPPKMSKIYCANHDIDHLDFMN